MNGRHCMKGRRRVAKARSSTGQRGFLMLEVLIALVILLLGILGLVALQVRAHEAELESYQRVQALLLLSDMASRINANRAAAADYLVAASSPLGKGASRDCTSPATTADRDLCLWDAALKGATESLGGCDAKTGSRCVGAMTGARGCITRPAPNQYLVQVVWQGQRPTVEPPGSVACGSGLYGDEAKRRAVTTVVAVGNLG